MTPIDEPEITNLDKLRSKLQAESTDSLQLLRDIKDNPVCSIFFDESVSCITVIWRNYATSTQLRFIHESILHHLQEHGVNKVLGDDSALPTIHAEDQEWIIKEWLPRAMAAGLKATANKQPLSHFGKVSVGNVQAGLPAGLITRSFDTLEDARAWLHGVNLLS